MRDPAVIRVLVAVWRLPVLDLRVQRADADAWSGIGSGPARRGRLAQAVLELPTVEERYLAGRPKQALRTNLRHARELGVTSGRVATYEEWFEAASVILNARPDGKAVGQEMDKPGPRQHAAYIRSIAQAVGADPEPLIREYDTARLGPQAIMDDIIEPLTPIRMRKRLRLNWIAVLVLVWLGFAAYDLLGGSSHASSAAPSARAQPATHVGPRRQATPKPATPASVPVATLTPASAAAFGLSGVDQGRHRPRTPGDRRQSRHGMAYRLV